jgi:hypothetical protein
MLKKLMQQFEAEFIGQSRVWEPVSDSMYYGRMSDKEIEDMRQRNEDAIQKCIEEMGEKWIMHPVHQVKRIGYER